MPLLREAGVNNVQIGILPDVLDGSKLGADDLILAKGKEPYIEALNNAVSPENYATKIGLDTQLFALTIGAKPSRKVCAPTDRPANAAKRAFRNWLSINCKAP